MGNADGLLNAIKQASMEAAEAGQPSDFCYGKVTSASPLKILVEQKLELGTAQLVLTRNVTDFETQVTVSQKYGWDTRFRSGGSGDASFESHNHDIYFDRKTIKIHNALKVGEKVVLIRQRGGQKYLVLDRIG